MYQALLEHLKKQRAVFLLIFAAVIVLPIIAAQSSSTRVNTPISSNSTTTPHPKYSGVTLPANYRDSYIHYANIQRPDGTERDVYIDPAAIDNLKMGFGIPEGTTIVIEGYYAKKDARGEYETDANGHYVKGEPFEMIHVRQKRADWQASDFVSEARSGDWNFGSFDTLTGKPYDESISACFNCHNAAEQSDFLFTGQQLRGYVYDGALQYYLCDLTGRTPCQ